jgi:sugar/nucleoside kinase (ribokinase family)
MKIGKGGCLVLGGGRLVHIPGEHVSCTDTTGAGDSFAAGFLYGLLEGRDLADCGRLGNRIASRIVTVEGARFDLLNRNDLLSGL